MFFNSKLQNSDEVHEFNANFFSGPEPTSDAKAHPNISHGYNMEEENQVSVTENLLSCSLLGFISFPNYKRKQGIIEIISNQYLYFFTKYLFSIFYLRGEKDSFE